MTPLEVVVVDDEPVAIRRLTALLRGIEGIEVTGTAANADAALALIQDQRPDLALLDVEMPGLSGVALAEQVRALPGPPAIVFVTAFSRFAVEAFDLRATDYLLKPVEASRLAEAIQRVRAERDHGSAADRIADLEDIVRRLRALEHTTPAVEQDLWLPDGQALERVPVQDILWVEAERDYVRIHTARRSYFVRGRLGEMEKRLSGAGMVRVHRSAMVRAAAVTRVEGHGERGYRLVLKDGATVDASRRFGSRVRALTVPPPDCDGTA